MFAKSPQPEYHNYLIFCKRWSKNFYADLKYMTLQNDNHENLSEDPICELIELLSNKSCPVISSIHQILEKYYRTKAIRMDVSHEENGGEMPHSPYSSCTLKTEQNSVILQVPFPPFTFSISFTQENEIDHQQLNRIFAIGAKEYRERKNLQHEERAFAAIVHDINNITTVLRALIDLEAYEKGATEFTGSLGEHLDKVEAMAQSVMHCLSARNQHSKKTTLKETNISDIISKAVKTWPIFVKYTNQLSCASNIPSNELLLNRIVANLISNASKYSTEIEIILTNDTESVYIDVVDRGPGLPPDIKTDDIFNYFERDEKSHSNGFGIGLASAKVCTTQLGGTLTAQNNTDGPGAKFTIKLPITQTASK